MIIIIAFIVENKWSLFLGIQVGFFLLAFGVAIPCYWFARYNAIYWISAMWVLSLMFSGTIGLHVYFHEGFSLLHVLFILHFGYWMFRWQENLFTLHSWLRKKMIAVQGETYEQRPRYRRLRAVKRVIPENVVKTARSLVKEYDTEEYVARRLKYQRGYYYLYPQEQTVLFIREDGQVASSIEEEGLRHQLVSTRRMKWHRLVRLLVTVIMVVIVSLSLWNIQETIKTASVGKYYDFTSIVSSLVFIPCSLLFGFFFYYFARPSNWSRYRRYENRWILGTFAVFLLIVSLLLPVGMNDYYVMTEKGIVKSKLLDAEPTIISWKEVKSCGIFFDSVDDSIYYRCSTADALYEAEITSSGVENFLAMHEKVRSERIPVKAEKMSSEKENSVRSIYGEKVVQSLKGVSIE